MWFTETPWPPICILAVGAAVCAAAFISTQRSVYLAGIALLGVFGTGVYIVEQQIVTEKERVETAIYGLADAFERRDVVESVNYFSRSAIILRALVALQISQVEVRDDLRISDVSIETSNNESRAKSHFRANGTFAVAGVGDTGHIPTRWEVSWQREGGEWKIIRVQRLDPITGEAMEITDQSVRL